MNQSPGWLGLPFVIAQLTIGEMGTITAMSATISGAFFYFFKTAISADIQKQLDARYVNGEVDEKDKEYLNYQLQQQRLQYERLQNSLQEAFRKIDEQERKLIAYDYRFGPGHHKP